MSKESQLSTKFRAIVNVNGKDQVFRNSYASVGMLIKKLKENGIGPSNIVRVEEFISKVS